MVCPARAERTKEDSLVEERVCVCVCVCVCVFMSVCALFLCVTAVSFEPVSPYVTLTSRLNRVNFEVCVVPL